MGYDQFLEVINRFLDVINLDAINQLLEVINWFLEVIPGSWRL